MKRKFSKEVPLRKRIGLSQENYILYLRANRSALAMYETKQRSLPFEAGIRHAAIEICLSKPETEKATEETVSQQQEAAVQVFAKRREDCLFFITKTQRQLAKMKQQYQQCLNMVRVAVTVPTILAKLLPNNQYYIEDVECLEIFGRSAKYKMEDCGISQQQLLQLKIDTLQFEADKIQQLLQS